MTPEKIAALLAKTNLAIVGVNRVNGGPQLTPVRYFWDGETFIFSTTTDRAKYANLKRNPSLTLLVDDPLGYVAAYGEAEIIEAGFAELVRPIMEKYYARARGGGHGHCHAAEPRAGPSTAREALGQ